MESRGDPQSAHAGRRPAIPRRSCDQCRARKVGCDRGSPCSNCVSTKLSCTFSAVASKTTTPAKQRVLISAQYEQKIDEIAEGIEAIKLLLQNKPASLGKNELPLRNISSLLSNGESSAAAEWDHSVQINEFVRIVAEDRASRDDTAALEENDVIASLKRLARVLESSDVTRDLSFPETKGIPPGAGLSMPPVEAAVIILRWAKEHRGFFRIESVARILPLERFTDICQKVYFAVDEHSDVEFILANSYLSYVCYEYVVATGRQEYQEHYMRYRQNAQVALSRLPLLLPASIEAVAALTFGASFAIESSKTTLGWTYISTATNLCQTLGLHQMTIVTARQDTGGGSSQENKITLFWLVFMLEKSLSLRLGRPTALRNGDITTPLPESPTIRRCSMSAIIQGKIYDQLYSPAALARPEAERGGTARVLAAELRELINENRVECYTLFTQSDFERDIMRPVYLKIELLIQLSLLTLVLRAVPPPPGSLTSIADECATAAHEALEVHHECMAALKGFNTDQIMANKYLHWGILHTPFVPFSVLSTRMVQLSDVRDLSYLDRFTESLHFGESSSAGPVTHPYRLYKLLCQALRLYINQDVDALPSNSGLTGMDAVDPWSVFDFASFGAEASSNGANGTELEPGILSYGLSDWFYGNQQLMNLLDDDVMF